MARDRIKCSEDEVLGLRVRETITERKEFENNNCVWVIWWCFVLKSQSSCAKFSVRFLIVSLRCLSVIFQCFVRVLLSVICENVLNGTFKGDKSVKINIEEVPRRKKNEVNIEVRKLIV